MNAPFESALVVLIPEAEDLVENFRNQYDPSAALGMPAHVTILYPFKPPSEITADVILSLEELFAKFPAFNVSFTESRRFPNVLYLSRTEAERFESLTVIVTKRFPETLPYGGRFADIIPHLTVAEIGDERQLDKVAADFERAAERRLPIQTRVKSIALMDNQNGRWQVRTRFALSKESRAG